MNHAQLPTHIHTDRLVIRPFKQSDLALFLSFMTNERVTRYLGFNDEHRSDAGARELFYSILDSYDSSSPLFAYAVALKDGTFVGSCGIMRLPGEGVIECYYGLLHNYWGRGYATETTESLIRYCFEHQPVREIRAFVHPENSASSGVVEKVGMVYLGLQTHPESGNEGKLYSITRQMHMEQN
jgi:ribosomal-protein-alanine N-acetyltransferase